MLRYAPISFPNKLSILLNPNLSVKSLLSQVKSVLRPLSKFSLAHSFLHETSIMLFVCTGINQPYRIRLDFLSIAFTETDITAGLYRITADSSCAEVRKSSVLHNKPSSAVTALYRHMLFFNALEQFKIQISTERCETIGFAEYRCFFCFNDCMTDRNNRR